MQSIQDTGERPAVKIDPHGRYSAADELLLDTDEWDSMPTEPFERLERVRRSNEASGEIELSSLAPELEEGQEL